MNKLSSLGAVALLGGSAIAFSAQAAETEYSFTWCGHGKSTMLTAGPDITVWTEEVWGITTPESTFKPYENATVHCVGYNRLMQGKTTTTAACQFTDATGDTFVGEDVEAPDKPPLWTFLAGTGKWQGVSGSGTAKYLAVSKPAADGTVEFCVMPTGKYTLPK